MNAALRAGRDAIAGLMPWLEEGEERRIRNGLLQVQQLSATRARAARSSTARDFFWTANATAAALVTAPASMEVLRDVHAGLIRLGMAANMFERLESGRDG